MELLFKIYDEVLYLCKQLKDKTNLKTNYIEYISALLYIKYSTDSFFYDDFSELYQERNNYYIAELIDDELERIRNNEKDKYLFSNIKFKDIIIYRDIGEENILSVVILNLYKIFENKDVEQKMIVAVYRALLEQFIQEKELVIGDREFYTPNCITNLMSKLVFKEGKCKVYDPACGSGNFLISANSILDAEVYGDESNINYYNICKTTLLLCEIDNSKIKFSNTVNNEFVKNEKYDIVMCNPPFSTKNWIENANKENKKIFKEYKMKSTSVGDYAYLLKCLSYLNENGNMAIILPHGALFRNSEKETRKELVNKKYIKAVIGLPENLFFDTRLSVVILIISKRKADDTILFIDASQEYQDSSYKKCYEIPEESIQKILDVYNKKEEIEGFSHVATIQEIENNEYNLSIKKYVKQIKSNIQVDKIPLAYKILNLEREASILEENIKDVLEVLGMKEIANLKIPKNQDYDFDYSILGKNIRKQRIKKGYTQEKLADELGISLKYISRIESGASGIKISTLAEICKLLNVEADKLLFK